MANDIFNADEAVKYLNASIETNNEIAEKFRSANEKIQMAFTNNGEALSGKLGDLASTTWGNNAGVSFEQLTKASEDFLQDKVPDIIAQMSDYQATAQAKYQESNSTNATYGG